MEKCLVIGLGQIGMGYDLHLDPLKIITSHARAISLHSDFELAGAVDSSSVQRTIFETHYVRPAFDNIYSAMQQLSPSVVIISSPTDTHLMVLDQVLSQNKPKVILCEKPLAYNVVDALKMVQSCDRFGVDLFVNYIRRADPGAIEIKRRLDTDEISVPIKGVVWYTKGFLNNASHFLNLLEFWLGEVVGFNVINTGRLWDNLDPEPDVEVKFERGAVTFLSAWEEAFSISTLELVSKSGRLRYEQSGSSIEWHSVEQDLNFSGYKILGSNPEIILNRMDQYQWNMLQQLSYSLAGKAHTLCTGRQALNTLEAIHKILKGIQI